MSDIFEKLLAAVPGAKRAQQGVLFPLEDGGVFHLQGIISDKEMKGLTQDETFFLAFCSKNEILRLRSLNTCHDYLLHIRAMSIVDEARLCRVFRHRKTKFKQWSLSKYYDSKIAAKHLYIHGLPLRLSKIIRPMASGLAMIKEPNASCRNSVLGTVVVVSESLEYLLYFMNLGFYGPRLGIPPENVLPSLAIALRILLGVESLDFDLDPRGKIPNHIDHQIKRLTLYQMAFIYGHEYSHHLLGHLVPDSLDSLLTQNNFTPLNFSGSNSINYQQEFDADYFSIMHIENNKKLQQNLTLSAIHLFEYFDFLDAILFKFNKKKIFNSLTHPSHSDRVTNLINRLDSSTRPDPSHLADLHSVSNDLREILISSINENSKANLLDMYGSVYLPTYINKPKRDRIDF